MGGAHVAAGNGVYAAPYNPASIGFVKGSDTFWSKSNYVAGITHNVLGYATQLTESILLVCIYFIWIQGIWMLRQLNSQMDLERLLAYRP